MATPRPEDERPLPAHVTLPLLDLVTRQSMDVDYQHAARRKAERGEVEAQPSSRRHGASAVVVAVFGVLVAIAAVQTSQNADVEALGRASLISRIQAEKEALRQLQDTAGALREENVAIEEDLRDLRSLEEERAQRARTLGIRTGNLAVQGPGIRVVVDDAPGDGELVRDEDLAILVDGLWAAGAEAVAINGQRLTALSSIHNSGKAINVNVRPLNPPYEVVAIGNPDTLPGRLLETTHGAVWFSLARTLGFVFEMSEDEDLRLPAARVGTLRHAKVGSKDDLVTRKDVEP